ncbi:MAG: pyridoxamine 5'-phosphate oxidase family protein [Deltaproteobacteria bacterium]|nr:pyridoxamine 5'-phosphate oxidase family protein [Candidatus Anaeroferrophillus wilburensis]MBN2887973.1 pyridoxamine 5'-phosphate oxidase family protein [Deltaproteobacteria bacterium]
MAKLPEAVKDAWEHREGPIVFSTVDENGVPNAIYATCVALHGDGAIVVADNYFDKTKKNILAGSRGSILFITKENKAYQVKGSIEYYREGDIFEAMKQWNPTKHPGHAAAVLWVEKVYSGAEKIL